MFRDLQKGYTINILDKTGSIPAFKTGTVVSVSAPRFESNAQLAGVYHLPFSSERVVDLTVETGGETVTYVVPEVGDVASSAGVTISCDVSGVSNELRAIIKRSRDILADTDKHKEIIEKCEALLSQTDPAFAQGKVQNERIGKVESTIARVEETLSKILSALSPATTTPVATAAAAVATSESKKEQSSTPSKKDKQ